MAVVTLYSQENKREKIPVTGPYNCNYLVGGCGFMVGVACYNHVSLVGGPNGGHVSLVGVPLETSLATPRRLHGPSPSPSSSSSSSR